MVVLLAIALPALALTAAVPAAAKPIDPGSLLGHRHAPACGAPLPNHVACHAMFDLDVAGPLTTSSATPYGYGPSDLQAAYSLPSSTAGSGHTVAVVAAFDLPTAQDDLNTYRAQFGLPACGPGCFTKVNQNGGSVLPPVDPGWGQEIALDIDMVSAACPNCKILLVEANSTSIDDLGAAVNTAVRLGAVAVSNSYGGPESARDITYDSKYFNHPGVAITVSTGDSGYEVNYPASSQYVTAVGGTTLKRDGSTRGFAETAWSGAGSGCSAYEPKPAWQKDTGCAGRTVADVAAVADPNTGVAVYDSTTNLLQSGWLVAGGTSASAPFIAGIYALAPTPPASSIPEAFPYANPSSLFDVTSGSNGFCGTNLYLCNAGYGYDGPTGLGTPHGISAFSSSPTSGGSPTNRGFSATGPSRVLDTRSGTGAPMAQLGAQGSLVLAVPGLPAGVTGVVLNLTATSLNGADSTYISACPAAQALSTCMQTSILNPNRGVTIANEVTVPVGPDGRIQLYNNGGAIDLVGDLAGYFTS